MNALKKNCTFYVYSILLFSIIIIISEANENKLRSHQHHHHHHDSDHSKSTADRMCHEYTKQACNENLSRRRLKRSLRSFHGYHSLKPIIGGIPAMSKQYPHMALLGYETAKGTEWQCGGTLISKNFVLTAAHCTDPPPPRYIRLGELDLASRTEDAITVDYEITKIHVHPDYHDSQSDIALLKFRGVPSFTAYIRPICLNVHGKIPHRKFSAQGWGVTAPKGPQSSMLLTVELDQQSDGKCELLYGSLFDGRKNLCIGYAAGGKGTCLGDSGGPMLFLNYSSECPRVPIYTQVGITSGGRGCAWPDTPTVFTRVSYFIPWIESIVWKAK